MLIGLYLVIALSCKPITTLPNTETHLTPLIQSGRPKLDWIIWLALSYLWQLYMRAAWFLNKL